jgi:hypothetical protein
MIVGGAICASCAELPSGELCTGLLHYLRAVMPDATVIATGTA